MISRIAALFILLLSTLTFAADRECRDARGDFVYSTWIQQGGPCCGRSTTTLTYKGAQIQNVLWVGGMNGNGYTMIQDKTLSLLLREEVDLGNSYRIEDDEVTHTAVNLT